MVEYWRTDYVYTALPYEMAHPVAWTNCDKA